METLEKVGAKVNFNLEQLIVPYHITGNDVKLNGLKILSPNRSMLLVSFKKMNHFQLIIPFFLKEIEEIEERNLPHEHPWLLGYHLANGKDEIILTATAADTLAALDCLAVPALCLPSGKKKNHFLFLFPSE